jgi:hypothetical protein
MPITHDEGVARLTGSCTVEEAEPLLDWLRATPDPALDLSACLAAHSAVVQVLLAARPRVVAPPPDPVLAAALADRMPAFPSSSPAR